MGFGRASVVLQRPEYWISSNEVIAANKGTQEKDVVRSGAGSVEIPREDRIVRSCQYARFTVDAATRTGTVSIIVGSISEEGAVRDAQRSSKVFDAATLTHGRVVGDRAVRDSQRT